MCGGENNRTTKLSLKFLPNDIPDITEAESFFNQYDRRYWSNISEFWDAKLSKQWLNAIQVGCFLRLKK